MSAPAIEFENVGKLYHLGVVGTGTLSHDLNRWWTTHILRKSDPYLKIGEVNDRSTAGSSDFVWALRDINLKVEQGDVVGIIGRNGAGKSTLLKLLSRVTSPTTGVIRARGRIASLLEVGTGFHPELTGRENIYMNGSIMGMTKREISAKLDEIVDFAGVARYLDTPVKRYSSGMVVRLGFAVAAFLEPEILVVDEVLAVGDAEFQKKAIGKMQDVAKGEGRTVLFVSHNMAAVKNLCKSGVLMQNGTIVYTGSASDTINEYLSTGNVHDDEKLITEHIEYLKHSLKITNIEINGTTRGHSTIVSNQPVMTVRLEGETTEPLITDLMLKFETKDNVPMATLCEGHNKGALLRFPEGKFVIEKKIKLPKYLNQGVYDISVFLHHPMVEWQMRCPKCMRIEVDGNQTGMGHAVSSEHDGFICFETIG